MSDCCFVRSLRKFLEIFRTFGFHLTHICRIYSLLQSLKSLDFPNIGLRGQKFLSLPVKTLFRSEWIWKVLEMLVLVRVLVKE